MRLDFSGERVLAVVAHPDDAELLCAGTLTRAARDGAAIGICVLCQGDRGQPGTPIPNLAAIRRREMHSAAAIIGAELLLGEFGDGTLQDDPRTRERVVELLRQFRPTLILGHSAADYHADHRAASALVDACSWIASSRGLVTDSPPLEQPAAVWWMDTIGMQQFDPGFFVDVSPAILLLTPVFLPALKMLGVSPIQFGAVLITGLAVGLVTPPVGMCLNVCSSISGQSIIAIFRGALPFLLANVLVLLLITVFPALSTWLPALLMG